MGRAFAPTVAFVLCAISIGAAAQSRVLNVTVANATYDYVGMYNALSQLAYEP
jgi:hypothetical protein